MTLAPGNYTAKVDNYGLAESGEKKTPYLNVRFMLSDTGETVYWNGWLTEKNASRVITSLTEAELLTTKNFMDLADGPASNGIDMNKECNIAVINESTDTGKIFAKVSFVNPLGGKAMQQGLAKSEAISKLAGLNLDAEIAAAEQTTGKKIAKPVNNEFTADDIPF